uniref:SAC3/GANP/THP3 conserved domain-containing protein n=2 Tax=Brugia malayi TaxID=6279 RepID=A0A8L7T2N4_BRUMA
MSSGSFPFIIPESLRPKKASNPSSKLSVITRKSYTLPRRKGYNDLDDPLGPSSSSTCPSSPFKRSVDVRLASGRNSVARAARVVRKRMSSTQHAQNISQDLPSASVKPSLFGSVQLGKRLNASLRGTLHSGVDNRFTSVMRTVEPSRPWAREPAVKEENVPKLERHTDNTKVESVTEKVLLPKGAVARQLKRMIGRVCETDYDKYQLLDERDRLMHRGRLKSTDVDNATVMQGSCCDMCPEKERYMRVVQKRLSAYECHDDGSIAPELTVKEYSRSAADQEEPLPHELRPADVLQRTMNYLVGKIANHVPETDEELAQWYDFLWNRTRAIRKDITQQMMVNETAVTLIEQCVRLHIFASHRLCELNFNEFDQKMNTENLSKSLQSLRYLYDDLAKKGVHYSSEAEFRAYEIMLNLSDSNVFRQALTYRREILEAGSVRLAIRLFTCLQNQNYVRFFRLLKNDATYLQCCLCHRFFNRMRHQAMYAISHSIFIMGKYPVNKFVQLLGFDDRDASLQFLGCYNVRRNNDMDTGEELMHMSKAQLIESIEEPPSKIHLWIEAKRDGYSIPEVLSGCQDVEVEIVTPLNSFDRNGTYLFDVVLDNYINENGGEQLTTDEDETVTFAFTLPQKENNAISVLAEKLSDEIIEGEVTRLCKLVYSKSLAHLLTTVLYDSILEDCLKPCCQEVMIVAKLLHRRKLAADVAKQREDEIRLLLDSLNKSILDEVIDTFIQDISKKWIIKCQRVHNEELIEDIGKSFLNDLLAGVLIKTVRKIAEKEIEEGVNYVKQRLKDINERLDKLWLKQFVNRWREQIAYRKEQERKKLELLGSFPVILPAKSGLIFRRRDGYSLDEALQLDCSSLLFEQKINAFIKKRHGRIARKVLMKWRLWTHLQIEKREFFTSTYTSSPLKRKRLHSNNNNIIAKENDDIRLAAALADMECERLKPFWATNQIRNDLEDKRQVSWYESLAQRSSLLLNFFDEQTLEKGVEIAERNIQRTDCTERWMTNKNNLECNESLNSLTYNPSQQQYYKKNNEFSVQNEGYYLPAKRECKNLENLEKRLKDFNNDLDDAFRDMEERNRRYDEILKRLSADQ